MFSKNALVAAVITLCFPALAWADGSASIMSGGETTTVEFSGEKFLRMDAPEAGGYMLLRDDKLYSVAHEGDRVMVFDIAAALKAMGGSARQESFWDEDVVEVVSFENTGENETVAGIPGEVYELQALNREGKKQVSTLVLTEHPIVVELSAAMFRMSETLVNAIGDETPRSLLMMKDHIIAKDKGILRQGEDFEIISITENSPSAERFALPAEPMKLPFGG